LAVELAGGVGDRDAWRSRRVLRRVPHWGLGWTSSARPLGPIRPYQARRPRPRRRLVRAPRRPSRLRCSARPAATGADQLSGGRGPDAGRPLPAIQRAGVAALERRAAAQWLPAGGELPPPVRRDSPIRAGDL